MTRLILILGTTLFVCNGCFRVQENDNNQSKSPKEIEAGILKSTEKKPSIQIEQILSEQKPLCFNQTLKPLYQNPIGSIRQSDLISTYTENNAKNTTALTSVYYKLLGYSAGGYGPPLSASFRNSININNQKDLNDALYQLKKDLDLNFQTEQYNLWKKLPFEAQASIVEILLAMNRASKILNEFTQPHTQIRKGGFNNYILQWLNREMNNFSYFNPLDDVDFRKLAYATRILNDATEKLINSLQMLNLNNQGFTLHTKLGRIGLFGKQNDTLTGNYALCIDFGGDDVHWDAACVNNLLPGNISINIDFKGNDKYISKKGSTCFSFGGITILHDLKGNDEYFSKEYGLAFSLYGASLLVDHTGNDRYKSSNFSQGSAIMGLSTLFDFEGNDTYFSGNYSQGFGSTSGVGVIYDKEGNDNFNVPDLQNSNSPSFVQGSAKGRWAEATDGHNLAGGVGVFLNGSGNDKYYSKSFSQGAAYYFGHGIFMDKTGNDIVNAISHSQGYAAHFGLANFTDYDGNDYYNTNSNPETITQIMGSGRDCSSGIFIDLKGEDNYTFGNRSTGISDLDGIGIFWDESGNDNYTHIRNSKNKGIPSCGKLIQTENNISLGIRFLANPVINNTHIYHDTNDKKSIKTVHLK